MYHTTEEYQMRKENWEEANELIKAMNKKSAESGRKDPARFGHNKFSDLTRVEK